MKLKIFSIYNSRLTLKCYFSSIPVSLESDHDTRLPPLSVNNQFEYLAKTITPLANLEYADQLKFKQRYAKSVVHSIYKRKSVPNFGTKISKILPSPIRDMYRNKDEFSINKGIDGDPKTVGFYIRSPIDGEIICVPPTELINIKKKHIEISQLFQEFIRVSPLRACLAFHDGGFWRNLIVRSNLKEQTMITVTVHPNGADEEVINDTMEQFSKFFSEQDINSIYYQACPHTKCSSSVAPYKLLYGKKYLFEELGSYKFQISPDSFFQINTHAAEILYNKALELADTSNKSTLLDLCSGIGAISIFASSYVRGCVGIEILEEAVKDSMINANLNGVTNCDFIAGSVEQKLTKVLKELDCSPDIIAILNPGRSGVLKSTVRVLRRCPTVRTLIYIACKADHKFTMKNFVNLLDPNFDGSSPFVLTCVQPVDMFPQTNHTEMIMVFKR